MTEEEKKKLKKLTLNVNLSKKVIYFRHAYRKLKRSQGKEEMLAFHKELMLQENTKQGNRHF